MYVQLETGIRFRPSLVLPTPSGRFRIHTEPLETNIAVWRMVPGLVVHNIIVVFSPLFFYSIYKIITKTP